MLKSTLIGVEFEVGVGVGCDFVPNVVYHLLRANYYT